MQNCADKAELPPEAKELVKRVDGLPLALAQAGAYLRSNPGIADYLELYRNKWKEIMAGNAEHDVSLKDYAHGSVGTTWSVSYEYIKQKHSLAAVMLKILAYLHGSDIGHEIFRVDDEQTLALWRQPPPVLVTELYDLTSFKRLMTVLVEFAFLQRSPGRETFEMHPVVQDWCLFSSSSLEQDEICVLAIRILGVSIGRANDKGFMEATSIRKRLQIHLTRFLSLLDPQIENRHGKFKETICRAWFEFGVLDHYLDNYDRAIVLYRRSFHGLKDISCNDNALCIIAGWSLAKALASTRRYAEAEHILEGILEALHEKDCNEPFMRSTILCTLAETCANLGRSEKAERLYRQVLAFYSQNKPDDYSSIHVAKEGLGDLLMAGKRTGEAAEIFAEELSTAKDLWPEFPRATHGDLVCTKLAAAYKILGKYEEARSVLLMTLSWFEEAYGIEDDWVFQILRYLGGAYVDLEQFDKAEQQYRRILLRKKEWDPLDKDQWIVPQSLANVLRKENKFHDAEELCRQILQVREKALGPGHCDNFETKYYLGLIREDEGRHEEAELFYQEAFNGRKGHVQDRSDIKLMDYTQALGNIARIRGRYAEASTLLVEVTALREQVLGVDHVETLHSKLLLSLCLKAIKEYAMAERLSKKAFRGREKLFGRNALPTLSASRVLADVLRSQGRYQDAEAIYKEDLMVLEQRFGRDSIELLEPSIWRSQNLMLMQEYKTAEAIQHRCLELSEMSHGQTDKTTLGVLLVLINCLHIQHNHKATEKFCKRYCTGMYEILKVGPESFEASDGLFFLGRAYMQQIPPKLELAVSTFQSRIHQRTLGLGPGHTATLIATLRLAMVYQAMGKLSQAAELLPQTIKGLLTSRPRLQKIQLIHALKLQGEILWSLGKYDLARLAYRYCLAAWLQTETKDPPIAIFIRADLERPYTTDILERHYNRRPEPPVDKRTELQNPVYYRWCSGCKTSPIYGPFHHCVICQDTDLCANCFHQFQQDRPVEMPGGFPADGEELPRLVIEGCSPDHDFAAIERNSWEPDPVTQAPVNAEGKTFEEWMANVKEEFLAEMREQEPVWMERLAVDD